MVHRRATRSRPRLAVAVATLALVATATPGSPAAGPAATNARAALIGPDGDAVGGVALTAVDGAVRVEVTARGLTPGFHGFHVHTTGLCEPGASPPFGTAGGHLGSDVTDHPGHAGDMPPLYAQPDGVARARFLTDRFTLEQLLAGDGAAVMIHAGRDNLANIPARYRSSDAIINGADATTRATGDSGGRAACGVIQAGRPLQPSGYYLVASDGGIFGYGDARFRGSRGGDALNKPIVGMAAAAGADGYYLVASDGGVFSYGAAPFAGSTGNIRLNSPIVGMAALPLEVSAGIIDDRGITIGRAQLAQGDGHVRVHLSARGLPPGFHGLHIHATGICDPDAGFVSAGGHLGGSETVRHPDHPGDLPSVHVDAAGRTTADFRTARFTVEDLLDADGAAVMIHAGPDNFANIPDRYTPAADEDTKNTGDAGSRLACGPLKGHAQGDTGQKPLRGYWLVAADGGVFAFGDAAFLGSAGAIKLVRPVVGMATTPTGGGYWLVADDGGIFNYGDAPFVGSTGAVKLNRPIVGMAPTPSGQGYWLVGSDGGVFNFGDADLHGSLGGTELNSPIVAIAATATGDGYWLFAADGGVFAFGDASFAGSAGGTRLNKPIVGAAADPA